MLIGNIMKRISIFEEYRLIERCGSEINAVWKGAHILLFFLTFVFGSFCTFCFHMLMYLFDDQCVLFPKTLSLSSIKHNIIYEFIPPDKDLPVDFLSTQWVDKSVCYLPTYVPLVSGIFGLVWTTMFLMCSTGSRTLTGLQRPWRMLPPVFIFSLAMGAVCIYSSTVTHSGLQELCLKLGEITGSSTCTYTINVATLVYERRIRGVYQATRLTIYSAWMHTACWLFSALLTLTRVILAVDFQLVCVRTELRANIDKMLEKHEKQILTISPDPWFCRFEDYADTSRGAHLTSDTQLFYKNTADDRLSSTESINYRTHEATQSDVLYFSKRLSEEISELTLVPEECDKLARISAYKSVPKNKKFIVKIIYDFFDKIDLPKHSSKNIYSNFTTSSLKINDKSQAIARQYGQDKISSKTPDSLSRSYEYISIDLQKSEEIGKEIKRLLIERLNRRLDKPTYRERQRQEPYESTQNIAPEMTKKKLHITSKASQPKLVKKRNVKSIGIQTDQKNKQNSETHKVQITVSKTIYDSKDHQPFTENVQNDKQTQTAPKEKED